MRWDLRCTFVNVSTMHSLYICLCSAPSNTIWSLLFPLRTYCLARRGGIMGRAWVNGHQPQSSKAQAFFYWVEWHVKDWNSAVHGSMTVLLKIQPVLSSSLLSSNILLSSPGWLNVCLLLLMTPSHLLFVTLPFNLCLFSPFRSSCDEWTCLSLPPLL